MWWIVFGALHGSTECNVKACTASLPLVAVSTRYPFYSGSIFSPSSTLGVSSTQRITGFMRTLQKIFGLSGSALRWRCPRRCEPGLEGRLSVLLSRAGDRRRACPSKTYRMAATNTCFVNMSAASVSVKPSGTVRKSLRYSFSLTSISLKKSALPFMSTSMKARSH
jgi:hypothetical protein